MVYFYRFTNISIDIIKRDRHMEFSPFIQASSAGNSCWYFWQQIRAAAGPEWGPEMLTFATASFTIIYPISYLTLFTIAQHAHPMQLQLRVAGGGGYVYAWERRGWRLIVCSWTAGSSKCNHQQNNRTSINKNRIE